MCTIKGPATKESNKYMNVHIYILSIESKAKTTHELSFCESSQTDHCGSGRNCIYKIKRHSISMSFRFVNQRDHCGSDKNENLRIKDMTYIRTFDLQIKQITMNQIETIVHAFNDVANPTDTQD